MLLGDARFSYVAVLLCVLHSRSTTLNNAQVGYRHIDTAEFYENESEVGEAVRSSGVPREELYITTKLWLDGHGAAAAKEHFRRSLKNLGLSYVDLYLIHSPGGGKVLETYDALLELQKEGLVRSIGVSNFGEQVGGVARGRERNWLAGWLAG
jgi:diketogulonate reductase-like aldo/keto reductase